MKMPFWPIAANLGSSMAVVLGREVFGSNHGAWLKKVYRVFYRIDRLYWKAQYRLNPKHQYHVVRTGLRPGYHDPDNLMLYACMKCLKRYIEESGGVDALDKFSSALRGEMDPNGPQSEHRQADCQTEATTIYKWWIIERPANEARRDELMRYLYGNGRVNWVKVPGSSLSEMQFTPFEGDEIALENEFRALEDKIDEDEQTMLHRLIEIRRGLWT